VSRFDYVQYDEQAAMKQEHFKGLVTALEAKVEEYLPNGRAKALVLTNLEEVYMWIGKGIRDEQIARNGSAPLQERRKDG